ncbi:MAG: class I SAM-dependent methyltransferase [Hespellia sp.]|nr:class I SAM-dependent methyltransferase [Hespellia sp.]
MFWDNVAGVYDLFVNIYNKKTHKELREKINSMIKNTDEILECACGTGMLTVGMAQRCKHIIATDFSMKMLKMAKKKCDKYKNIEFANANIMQLDCEADRFDKVVAANVIHLLDNPNEALRQMMRVCKTNGEIIIPTYMNRKDKGNNNNFSKAVGKAGADFKRQFTFETYKQFFEEMDISDVKYTYIDGRVPCAVAVIVKH